jgi:ABC-type bacteriocin/lantibiotic exporter with double-glycine peptidase domain
MKYLKFLISLNKKSTLAIVIFFLIISTFLEYAFVGAVPLLLNTVFKGDSIPNFLLFQGMSDRQLLLRYVLILILSFFLLKNVFYFLNQYFVLKYSFTLHNNLSRLLISKYLNDKYLVFINSKTSELLRNVKDNTDLVRQLVTNSLVFFSEILVFVGLCFIIIYNSSLISIFSIIFIILFSCVYLYFSRGLSKSWSLKRQIYESSKIQYLQESFYGFKELKLFNKESLFINNYNEKNINANVMNLRFNLLYLFPRVYLEVIGALGVVVLIVLNLKQGNKDLFLNVIPLLGLYFVAFIRLLPSVNRILNAVETHRYALPALKIIYNDLKTEKFKNVISVQNNIFFKKNIRFRNVYFSFSKDKNIFNNVNLEIKYGDKIGIVGESGIGKTTLVNLISGLLEPTKGSILSDGVDVHKNIKSWQSNIGYIYQSTFLMNDTVENNISFNSKKDDLHYKKISKIIKLIKLNSLINKLPKGLNTIVGDDGAKLSGGQIQRIGIARALYFDRKLLICDEITNSLDNVSENSVINSLKVIDKTIIIISHKMQNLDFCSKIYEIKKNKLFLVRKK